LICFSYITFTSRIASSLLLPLKEELFLSSRALIRYKSLLVAVVAYVDLVVSLVSGKATYFFAN